MSSAFEAGSGFSMQWVHNLSLLVSGVLILIVGAILIACMVQKLTEGVMHQGDIIIWSIIFIASTTALLIAVFQGM